MWIRSSAVVVAYVVSYFVSPYFAQVYLVFSSSSLGGTFITPAAAEVIVGIPLGLTVLVVLLLTALGGKKQWWWIGIALIPAILFEVLIDLLHIYFPIILGLIACGLGMLAHKALQKLAPGFMTKIE